MPDLPGTTRFRSNAVRWFRPAMLLLLLLAFLLRVYQLDSQALRGDEAPDGFLEWLFRFKREAGRAKDEG